MDEIPLGVVDPVSRVERVAKIVRPASEDEVLDMYVELGLLDRDPYWAALWPSSIALARGVAAAAERDARCLRATRGSASARAAAAVAGKDACDLGSGLGLAGIAAAMCGAREVVFYDREPLALQCCLLSAELNGLDVSVSGRGTASGGGGGGGDEKSTRLCDAETFDWNAVPADQRTFDLVLACDVLYEPGMAAPVASLVPTLTRRGGGRWLLADPPNRAPRNREKFLELVYENGKRDGWGGNCETSEPRREIVTHRGSTDEVLLMDFIIK